LLVGNYVEQLVYKSKNARYLNFERINEIIKSMKKGFDKHIL